VSQQRLTTGEGDASFFKTKIATARFFADHYLSTAVASRDAIVDGSAGVLALEVEAF
jgi:butyryl-CoA dehydrogenase